MIATPARRTVAALLLAAAACSLSACGAQKALGFYKNVPDEFRVVAKAPLVVPPDYSLRPPAPGEPRPQELQPESQARLALLGQQQAVARDQGESLLVAKAGAQKADPLIRYVIDDEQGSLAHKDKSFADSVMFWRGNKADSAAAAAARANASAANPAPLDPASEEAKTKALTGGQPVVIARLPAQRRIKLPGL